MLVINVKCIPYCPVGTIKESDNIFTWLHSIRKAFSGPTIKHRNSNIRGRETEEVKTNNLTVNSNVIFMAWPWNLDGQVQVQD